MSDYIPHFSEHGGHFKHYKFLWLVSGIVSLIGTGALLDALHLLLTGTLTPFVRFTITNDSPHSPYVLAA